MLDSVGDSFAYCADAIVSVTDQNTLDLVRQGEREVARSEVLAGLLAHKSQMCGISTVNLW